MSGGLMPMLGEQAQDIATGINGQLVARTQWHDRSEECAILRPGTNHDGLPWDIHWFPAARLRPDTQNMETAA